MGAWRRIAYPPAIARAGWQQSCREGEAGVWGELGEHHCTIPVQQLQTVLLGSRKVRPGKGHWLCRRCFSSRSEEHQSWPAATGSIALPVSSQQSHPNRQQDRRGQGEGHEAPTDASDCGRFPASSSCFQRSKQLELAVTSLAPHYVVQ